MKEDSNYSTIYNSPRRETTNGSEFSQCASPRKSPRKSDRLAVFIPCPKNVWVLATCNAASVCDENGNIEFTVEDPSIGAGVAERRLLNVDIRTLPLHNLNIGRNGVEDMCDLGFLHEASILNNLQRRFENNLPYTRSGEILIAVNPYNWLGLYSQSSMETYSQKLRHELPPHVFATSAEAYRGLRDRQRNQSILVSGESGAGKTETVKIMLNMLAHVATPVAKGTSAERSNATIVQKIISANPLLESFGNAKTVRNDNSSRFGKFTELQFERSSSAPLVGSKCTTYLLEKSRVVVQNDTNERNYHVFYQLLAHRAKVAPAADIAQGIRWQPKDFRYMNLGDLKTSRIEGKTDIEHYNATIEALTLLGVRQELRRKMEDVLLGILHFGEYEFEENSQDALRVRQKGEIDMDQQRVTELFGLHDDINAFHTQITTRSIDAEGKSISVPLSAEQAYTGRDALAKEIYARLFQWLVLVINFTTSSSTNPVVPLAHPEQPQEEEEDLSSGFGRAPVTIREAADKFGTIALLDIFGFESFKVNRFEQLCINFANEKLQQKFCLDCFRTVQQEYRDEGLAWEAIPFIDNCETLFMIEGGGSSQSSIISILNEECLLGARGNDEAFLAKVKSAYGGSRGQSVANKAFSANLKSADSFAIHHYAGKVEYTVTQFVEKNRDTCPPEVHAVLARGRNPLLANLFGANGHYFTGSAVHDLLSQRDRQSVACILLLHDDIIPAVDLSSQGVQATTAPVAPRMRAVSSLQPRLKALGSAGVQRRQSFLNAETVTSKFKSQLGALLTTLGKTQCQYVRCIKPNVNKSPKEYNLSMVVSQLRSAGMIEAVRISRAAYPYRTTHEEFLSRFKALRSASWLQKQGKDARTQAGALLLDILRRDPLPSDEESLALVFGSPGAPSRVTDKETKDQGSSLWELGRTKLYFTNGILEHLEALRSNLVYNAACHIQAAYRGIVRRRKYLRFRLASIWLQARFRSMSCQRLFKNCRRNAVRLQAVIRGWLCRLMSRAAQLERASSKIGATYRMRVHRRHFLHVIKPACVLIQSLIKARYAMRKYILRRDKARHQADMSNRLAAAQQRTSCLEDENADLRREIAVLRAALSEATFSTDVKLTVDASSGSPRTVGLDSSTSMSPRPLVEKELVSAMSQTTPRPAPGVQDRSVETDQPALSQSEIPSQAIDIETQLKREQATQLMRAAETLMHQAVDAARKAGLSLSDAQHSHSGNTPTSLSLATAGEATKDSDLSGSPSPRIHKQDVKDLLTLMETGNGLSCTIYAVQKKGGTLVGKPAIIKKRADSSCDGGARIDCEVRTPSQPSSNGYTGITGVTTPKKKDDPVSNFHPAVAPTIKVLRFGIADVMQVRRGRCGLIQLPRAVHDSLCLIVTVRDKGELNFVMDSKLRCEVAYVAFHYLMQRCGANIKSSPSPVRSPIPAITARHTPGARVKVAGITPEVPVSPTRAISFRSPLMERAQRQANLSPKVPNSAPTGLHLMPPVPPSLAYGTPLHSTSPFKDKENAANSRKEAKNSELGSTDVAVRKALRQADDIIANEAKPSTATGHKDPTIVKRGWVTKADNVISGLSTPHWQRRFCLLERESKLLKFSQSELAEHYPSQVRSIVSLSPSATALKVVKNGGGGISSFFSGGLHILEIHNAAQNGGDSSVIKMQFETMDELKAWTKCIEDVIAGVR